LGLELSGWIDGRTGEQAMDFMEQTVGIYGFMPRYVLEGHVFSLGIGGTSGAILHRSGGLSAGLVDLHGVVWIFSLFPT